MRHKSVKFFGGRPPGRRFFENFRGAVQAFITARPGHRRKLHTRPTISVRGVGGGNSARRTGHPLKETRQSDSCSGWFVNVFPVAKEVRRFDELCGEDKSGSGPRSFERPGMAAS